MVASDFYILVVDDEESIRSILYETLNAEGYNVSTVASAEEALAFLNKELPHIILTDIRMEGMNGVELAIKVKEISEEIEVIIMTSHASLDTATEAIRIGVYDYINKPFNDLNEIKTLILRVIDKIYLRLENKHLMMELQEKNDELMFANKEILAISEEISAIYRFGKELSNLLDPSEIISSFLNYMSSLTDGKLAVFLKYYAPKNALVVANVKTTALKPKYSQEQISKFINVGMSLSAGSKVNVFSAITDIENNNSLKALILKLFETGKFIAYPLIIRDAPIGVSVLVGLDSLTEREKTLSRQYLSQLQISYDKALLHQKIKDLAIKDGLTGLFNHRYFQDRLELEVKRSKRLEHPLSIIFFDIDHFKKYNDQNGHPMGDMLLREISELLKRSSRSSDIVCRYGGEEFAIILPHTDVEGAKIKAESLRKLVEDTHFPNQEMQPNGNLTISIGVSEMPFHAEDPSKLLQVADDALYKVKKEGRNRVVVAEPVEGHNPSYKAKKVVTGPKDIKN